MDAEEELISLIFQCYTLMARDFVYPQNIDFKIEDCYFKDSGGGVIFYTGSQELIITNSVFTNNAPVANPPHRERELYIAVEH